MIYLLVDDLAGRARLAELEAALGDASTGSLNTSTFDGRVEIGELAAACEAMPFLSDRRLVILRGGLARAEGSGRSSRAGAADGGLAEYLARVPDTTDLVLLESDLPAAGAASKAIQTLVGQGRAEVVRDAPMDEARAIAWVRSRAGERGGRIGEEAAAALVSGAGTDARGLERELEKLLLLAADRPIEPADVRALVPAGDDTRVFELVDAIGNRNARAAVRAWRALVRAGEDPHRLLTMVARQIRLLSRARAPLAAGRPPAGLAGALGLPPFVARNLAGQARAWPAPALEAVLTRLVGLDRDAKTGGQELESSLELLVADLVAGRG
jgi:DNA polymerase-3 subunit delta